VRIEPEEKIAGHPALSIRRFMQRIGDSPWGLDAIQAALGVSPTESKKVAGRLAEVGLIERVGGSWRKTVKGNALAHASAARPLTRASADAKLKKFMERVATANRDERLAYRIQKVIVFGSFLTGRERINDIDIAIFVAPRHVDADLQEKLEDDRIAEARRTGRRFNNVMEEIMWPKREVVQILKSRSRALSIHSLEDEARVLRTERYEVLLEEPSE